MSNNNWDLIHDKNIIVMKNGVPIYGCDTLEEAINYVNKQSDKKYEKYSIINNAQQN